MSDTTFPHRPSAAFFDLDRTLISGSSAFVLGIAAWRGKLVPTHQFVRDAFSALDFALTGASDETSMAVRDRILGVVKDVRVDDLVALNADIVPKLMERVRPESRRLIELHRDAGRATYIVSASPIELVEPLAKALGMSLGTAKKHRENLQRKLDCHSAAELALLAIREGLLTT